MPSILFQGALAAALVNVPFGNLIVLDTLFKNVVMGIEVATYIKFKLDKRRRERLGLRGTGGRHGRARTTSHVSHASHTVSHASHTVSHASLDHDVSLDGHGLGGPGHDRRSVHREASLLSVGGEGGREVGGHSGAHSEGEVYSVPGGLPGAVLVCLPILAVICFSMYSIGLTCKLGIAGVCVEGCRTVVCVEGGRGWRPDGGGGGG